MESRLVEVEVGVGVGGGLIKSIAHDTACTTTYPLASPPNLNFFGAPPIFATMLHLFTYTFESYIFNRMLYF